MQVNKLIWYISLFSVLMMFAGCGPKYINYNDTIIKNIKWNTIKEYKDYRKENKNIAIDGYEIELYKIDPYFITTYGHLYGIALRDEQTFTEKYSRSYSKWFYDYTFLMFTLVNNPYNKELEPYYNKIDSTYDIKLNTKNINKFVFYPCSKNIIFDKWERDEDLKPLKATCYAKRLDKDVFLITRFAHPNTKEDTKLFKNEIIPTMLKSIKVTPTKLSPWKYQ